jgi:hypothetical protein
MPDVDRLFTEYQAEHRAGSEPDPRRYLEQVQGADRAELEALMDGYLARAPGREWNPEAFRGSAAERFVEAFAPSITADAGVWPTLLPRLRNAAQLKRADLVTRLAAALGAPESEAKVGDYYHQMEQGSLPVEGISDRVLEALGAIVGRSAAGLRSAGRSMAPPGAGPAAAGGVFARAATVDPAYAEPATPATASASPGTAGWDDVDELFRGRAA